MRRYLTLQKMWRKLKEYLPQRGTSKNATKYFFFFRNSFPDDFSKLLGIFETFSIWHNQRLNHFKALLGADICRLCAPHPSHQGFGALWANSLEGYEGSTLRHRMLYQAPFPPPPPNTHTVALFLLLQDCPVVQRS